MSKACSAPKKEEGNTLMLVSAIEELTNVEGLRQNGETETEQEVKGSEEYCDKDERR